MQGAIGGAVALAVCGVFMFFMLHKNALGLLLDVLPYAAVCILVCIFFGLLFMIWDVCQNGTALLAAPLTVLLCLDAWYLRKLLPIVFPRSFR